MFQSLISNRSLYSFATNTITRKDGYAWSEFGFAQGQQIAVDGVVVGTVASVLGAVMTLSGVGFPVTEKVATVAVFDPTREQIGVGGNLITVTGGAGAGPAGGSIPTKTGTYTVSGNVLRTVDESYWHDAGFYYGQIVQIGIDALWTVASVNGRDLTLSGPALPDGLLTATLKAFAPSPLVVLGGTTQDGLWYSGHPSAQMQRSLGTKPFPNQLGNGFPIFVVPVAAPFRFHGNNVLDASALYASAPAAEVPAFGLTMYGGGGDDLLIGSRARDFLFGGGGVDGDIIQGQNALNGDLVDYDSGVNVHIITRALSFPTWNQSVHPDADLLTEQRSRIRQVFDVPWQLAALINGSTDYTPPTAPGVTARPGTTPPTTPYVTLDPRNRSSQTPTTWVTNLNRPNFIVTPGLQTALPYYANGQLGLNAKIWLNGDQYTQEPLEDGTYILTATLTDYWGMTSAMAIAPKLVVVDSTAPDSLCGDVAVDVPLLRPARALLCRQRDPAAGPAHADRTAFPHVAGRRLARRPRHRDRPDHGARRPRYNRSAVG